MLLAPRFRKCAENKPRRAQQNIKPKSSVSSTICFANAQIKHWASPLSYDRENIFLLVIKPWRKEVWKGNARLYQ
ncbi:MAG: hypothetical protein LBN42_02555, partial [Oscillospiraceae bacterium]|nr:hypothetical protein [Oscillospiraceae bacterium]